MSCASTLLIPRAEYDALIRHLIRPKPRAEEAAFIYATFDGGSFTFVDWYPVPPERFVIRSLYHIELDDRCRAETIRRAHALEASLVECHSHPLTRRAGFSPSDCFGFGEYVPHVWWRLKGRPYAAFVFGSSSFDSLAWLKDPTRPDGTVNIVAGGKLSEPTGSTFAAGERDGAIKRI